MSWLLTPALNLIIFTPFTALEFVDCLEFPFLFVQCCVTLYIYSFLFTICLFWNRIPNGKNLIHIEQIMGEAVRRTPLATDSK